MKPVLPILLCLTAVAPAATVVVLDNKDHTAVVTTGSQANISRQSFRFTVAGGAAGNAAADDTVSLNSPIGPNVTLQRITFVEAPADNAGATSGSLFLKLFADAGATGAPLAISTNSVDVRGAINGGALSNLVWNFGDTFLSSAPEYHIRWSTNSLPNNSGLAIARIAAANFGSGFGDTYSGGTASINATTLAFDTRFEVGYTSVPEPTAPLWAGSIGLALVTGWRRRRR